MRSVVVTAVFLATASAWTPQSRYKGKQMHSYLRVTCISQSHASSGLTPPHTASGKDAKGLTWLPGNDKFRGVNLGSQFIIEPWMAADEFSSMGCGGLNDEWSCVEKLGQDAADAAFKKHWDSWTTQDDVKQMASLKLNTVRIPVGFWLREDLVQDGEHFPRGGIEYLDRLVGWCKDAGLYVIMDLHGGPGAQFPNQQYTGHVSLQHALRLLLLPRPFSVSVLIPVDRA